MRRSVVYETENIWNRETKRFLALLGIVLLFGCAGVCLLVNRYCAARSRDSVAAVACLLSSVLEAYPGTSEEALIAVLKKGADGEAGERLLGQYGIFVEQMGILSSGGGREKQLQMALLFGEALVLALLFLLFFLFFRRRQREIGRLCDYMNRICRGDFSLDMEENRETELSSLKNEIYKMAILLREQAANAVENKRAMADALADISHQLKTPLTSVTVLADNLLENQDMDFATRNRFLREMNKQIAGVTWLVNSLLKLSRLDAGVVELEVRELSLRTLLEEVCAKLEFLSELSMVSLEVQIGENLLVTGDAGWLLEAFLNLVKNALEHSYAGGRVEIAAEENEVYTQVTVRDHGEGIAPEEQRHLFERFYRGKTSGKDSVGIGLALAKEIIRRQDGYISVESGDGEGTTFFIKFLKCH